MTKEELLELEKTCKVDAYEWWSPFVVLNLIDEIKRLQGWEILDTLMYADIGPVHEIRGTRGTRGDLAHNGIDFPGV